MQESRDRSLLVDAGLGSEIEHIDAAELFVRRVADQRLDRGCRSGISRLPQRRKLIVCSH